MLINLGSETKLNRWLISRKIAFHMACYGNTPLDRWALRINKSIGISIKSSKDDVKEDTNILGHTIIQVQYANTTLEKIDRSYSTHPSIDGTNSLEIASICHEETEIRMKVFRDPLLAAALGDRILKRA